MRPIAGTALVIATACGAPNDVPVATVEQRPFVLDVHVEGRLEAAVSSAINVPRNVRTNLRIEWLAEDGARVAAGDPIARFDPTELVARVETTTDTLAVAGLRSEAHGLRAEAEARSSELDADVAILERELAERFFLEDEVVYSRHERIESSLDRELARSRERHALAAGDVRIRVSEGEGSLLELERRRGATQLEHAREGLAALTLRAPTDGLLLLGRNRMGEPLRPGDDVWPGWEIARLPELEAMIAQVDVLEADAGGLVAGLPAEVEVAGLEGRSFPATVEQVDRVAKPRSRRSPVRYFGARLAIDASDPEVLRPGLRVRARIRVHDQSEALVVPRPALFSEDSTTVVFRVDGARYEAVPVELEADGLGLVAVSGALDAGDRVALVDPRRGYAPVDGTDAEATP